MDIRNIKEKLPIDPYNLNFLETIFDIAKEQLKAYKDSGIEQLPDYPMNINIPRNQEVIKDFISRVIEELNEGFESTDIVYPLLNNDSIGWNMDRLDDESTQYIKDTLQNACEEQADALGFMMTILLYLNIGSDDLLRWSGKHVTKICTNLNQVMAVGRDLLISKMDDYAVTTAPYNIVDYQTSSDSEYIPGFSRMNYDYHRTEKLAIFSITYCLNMARNDLKCRPWKKTQVLTKENEVQSYIVEAFYLFMGFLKMYGFDPYSITNLYFKKYKLNIWRLKTNY